MQRVRVIGTGWTGGPSLNTFYFTNATEDQASATTVAARVRAAFAAVSGFFTASTVFTVQTQVDRLDDPTGNLTGFDNAAVQAPVVGTSAGVVMLPPSVVANLRLQTDTFREGRRMQGRAYIGPCSREAQSNAGGLDAAFTTALLAAGANLFVTGVGEPSLVVWRRPRLAQPAAVPPVSARVGSTAPVVSVGTSSKFASLRSRRD